MFLAVTFFGTSSGLFVCGPQLVPQTFYVFQTVDCKNKRTINTHFSSYLYLSLGNIRDDIALFFGQSIIRDFNFLALFN